MSCKCLSTIEKNLAAYHGTPVDLSLKMFITQPSMEIGHALPPLYYSYKEGKKTKKSYVTFNYCPFCGKKESE